MPGTPCGYLAVTFKVLLSFYQGSLDSPPSLLILIAFSVVVRATPLKFSACHNPQNKGQNMGLVTIVNGSSQLGYDYRQIIYIQVI